MVFNACDSLSFDRSSTSNRGLLCSVMSSVHAGRSVPSSQIGLLIEYCRAVALFLIDVLDEATGKQAWQTSDARTAGPMTLCQSALMHVKIF